MGNSVSLINGHIDEDIPVYNQQCPKANECQHSNEGCYHSNPDKCIRFLSKANTNLVNIKGTVEIPSNIDVDTFEQYFHNWLESMGWYFGGTIH